MNGFSIRSINANDLTDVLAIERDVHYSPWGRSSFERCIHGRYRGWVAVSKSDELCGYIVISEVSTEAELLNISVSRSCQGLGIGSEMLEFVCNQLSESCENFFLEVRASNLSAISLYEKFGFCALGRRVNYYPAKNGSEDAIIYALPL